MDGVLNTGAAGDDVVGTGVAGGAYPYLAGFDAVDQPGIAGQGNPNPPGAFLNHFVVKYTNAGNTVIYDPSYGAGPYNNENAHENAAIDGIISGSAVKTNNATVQELTYNPYK